MEGDDGDGGCSWAWSWGRVTEHHASLRDAPAAAAAGRVDGQESLLRPREPGLLLFSHRPRHSTVHHAAPRFLSRNPRNRRCLRDTREVRPPSPFFSANPLNPSYSCSLPRLSGSSDSWTNGSANRLGIRGMSPYPCRNRDPTIVACEPAAAAGALPIGQCTPFATANPHWTLM